MLVVDRSAPLRIHWWRRVQYFYLLTNYLEISDYCILCDLAGEKVNFTHVMAVFLNAINRYEYMF